MFDFCKVSWRKVIKKPKTKNQKPKIIVEYQPLIQRKKKFKLGKLIKKEMFWNKALIPKKIEIGDWVSIHWNQLIQILSEEDLTNLKKYTNITLDALNVK